MSTLQPCPFCGATPVLEDCRTIWAVRCKCGACVLGERSHEPDGSEPQEHWQRIEQTAIDAWNKRTAIAAPQPTADERVAEHMRLVAAYGAQVQRDAFSGASLTLKLDVHDHDYSRIVEVEASARALLSASQEDAEHAAMYRWLRKRGGASWSVTSLDGKAKYGMLATGEYYDVAIRAAMKETK